MNLQEIFDSDVGELEKRAWGWQGHFRWGSQIYTVELREIAVRDVHDKKAYEASFYLHGVKGDDAFSTIDTPGNPLNQEVPAKVYGVVLNSLVKVWISEDIDAIFFTAEHRHSTDPAQHERKELLYDALARRAMRRGGGYLYVHRGHGTEWLLSKQGIISEYWVNVLQEGLNAYLAAGKIVPKI